MNEAIIMKLDDKTHLLEKAGSVRGIERHPIPFPHFITETVDRQNIVERVLRSISSHQDREFLVSYDNYGLEASVNYKDGKFHSLILKGSGEEGDRLSDLIALKFVPSDIDQKGQVTMHVLLTIRDPQQFRRKLLPAWEVPGAVRKFIRLGKKPRYTSQEVVCRLERLYVDNEQIDVRHAWSYIGGTMTTEYAVYACYETMAETVREMTSVHDTYMLPMRGIVITDDVPDDEGAFTTRHFILDEYRNENN